jgi:hypothetical protein
VEGDDGLQNNVPEDPLMRTMIVHEDVGDTANEFKFKGNGKSVLVQYKSRPYHKFNNRSSFGVDRKQVMINRLPFHLIVYQDHRRFFNYHTATNRLYHIMLYSSP